MVSWLLPLVSLSVQDTAAPDDRRLAYVGRFARTAEGMSCQWSASTVRFETDASRIAVKFKESGHDYWVVDDGESRHVLALESGDHSVIVNFGDRRHRVVNLTRETEAFVGTTTFEGVTATDGTIAPGHRAKRNIEIVGDSISCGFGDEGRSKDEPFKPETESASLAYGPQAGKILRADVTVIAWSGRKMWPDNTTPSIYDEILPATPGTKWPFKSPQPDAIVVNLATNDFGKDNPDEKGWTGAYEDFVRRLWSHAPQAHIYLASGSMMSDNWPPGHKALSTLHRYLVKIRADLDNRKVHIIEFPTQKESDGIGSSWHPSLKTHLSMAVQLAKAVRSDLGW